MLNIQTIRAIALATVTGASSIALADTYVALDFPEAVSTDVSGINASGSIVGGYADKAGTQHGFSLTGGVFATIDYPGSTSTAAIAVNDRGDIAGFFLDTASQWHGFVLANGQFFVQDSPQATTGTFTLGISASGTLVGEFKAGQAFGQLGFAWILRHGDYAQLTPPDCRGETPAKPVQAFATAINSRGDVVGRLIDAAGQQCAWRLDKNGVYSILTFPGASLTNARGISAVGEVVGVSRVNGVNHGFVLPADDVIDFISIDFPGAASTRALGINSRGDIVGTYALAGPAGVGHGFVVTRDNVGDADDGSGD